MKNQRKKVNILDIISRLEKGERIVDIRRRVRFVYSSLSSIRYKADRITDMLRREIKCNEGIIYGYEM